MCNLKKGDIIFHSYHKKICAVSIAKSDCYEAMQPEILQVEQLWDNLGWRADCEYYTISNPIITSDYMDTILTLQPTRYAPFNKIGRGNTGYLFNCSKELALFLLDKLKIKNEKDLLPVLEIVQ